MKHQALSRKLRAQLAERLVSSGDLRTAEWRAAFESVPREAFLAHYFRHSLDPDGDSRWEPTTADVDSDPETWLAEIYSDDSLVTQLDGAILPNDVNGPTAGTPTSSATMPSLVARMWENLLVDDSSSVAEVGTGTGYSTALACARLQPAQITSVDVDGAVVAAARTSLASIGYEPWLTVADGLDGLPTPPSGGYDRVIAACSLRSVPRSWIESTKSGGKILLTLSGWLDASALARVDVTGPATAEGWFLGDPASFMPARRQVAPSITEIRTGAPDEIRSTTSVSAAVLDEDPGRLLVQLAVPNSQHVKGSDEAGRPLDYLVDVATGSYAVVSAADGSVLQGGPIRMWDAVEIAVRAWRTAGNPGVEAFKVTITAEHQYVGFPDAPKLWHLPE
ncbi:methyltransferase of ATP-grasp peptide maturase system [Kribbella sp. VKM Ac-2527]|uniref:Protein-L-isoaspartate O-methyltransferase n=1 Tax=Kribbella caucasensis TaxID=2512215 RepID=A0A4R6KR98_9ACTN|nr:ATP-grasp peptide maturase system methyltransferase [Kribbella sp. VKM Ac-2527]TDO54959.1 methyltransferase of ATP-grasp peptide maturase system [Kribbella sp. VKM Ac-2527]